MSGLQIYTAFPSFGVKIPQEDFWHFPEWMRLDWLDDPHLSFCSDDRIPLIRSGSPVDGGPARLVQFLFDVDRLET